MNALDTMTRKATAFPTFADLETACKSGYVPTLRTDQHCYNEYLAAELIYRGYRVYRGEAWS